jgi:molybdate transport system ATP-binding protein
VTIEVDVTLARGAFRLEARFASGAPIVALFGRSGSGKTTLVEAIAGLARPLAGRIAVDGRVLFDSRSGVDLAPEERHVGFVFQDALLFPHLSVRGNLEYGERLASRAHFARERIVALLGLQRLLERRPATLSGGEKQRVAIGRALMASPRVLLMDEPLASLDAPRKAEILQYVELLRDELRLPIVYVSHAIEEVTRLADHLVVLADGRVVAQGPAAQVLRREDMAPLAGRFEAGAVFETRVAAHDEEFGLTRLAFGGGELLVANVDALVGEPVRARIRARDVALALEAPRAASFQNVLEGTVESVGREFGAIVDVDVTLGGGERLVARVTRASAVRLGLAPGVRVFALVKAIAIDRRSVGFA